MSFTTETVTISEYTAIEDVEAGVGIYLNQGGKPFFVIDIPNRKILLNKSRMPATTWRVVFEAIQAFAEAHMSEDDYSALYGLGDAQPTPDMLLYKPYGLPEEMYVEYYTHPQYVIRDGKVVLLDEGGKRRMKPKIEFVWAVELDRYCVEVLGATYEIKKVVRGKNLVFDRLLTPLAVEV